MSHKCVCWRFPGSSRWYHSPAVQTLSSHWVEVALFHSLSCWLAVWSASYPVDLASSPGSPPPLCITRAIYLYAKLLHTQGRGRAWAALITCGHWWRVQRPPWRLRMWVQRNEKGGQISVFLGFLECSTDGSIDGQDYQLTFRHLAFMNRWQYW